NVNIVNAQYVALTSEEANIVDQNVEETHNLSVINSIIKKRQANFVKLYPIRKNPRTGILEKLVSFELQVQTIKENSQRVNKTNHYADNSVLQAGEWYKVGVLESKVYKLSYHFLKQMGMDVDNLNPQNLRVYGN